MSQKEFIPALGYHWMTGLYDLAIRLTMPEKRFRQKLTDEVAPSAEESILEFGFGTGANLLKMLQTGSGASITGLDIDPKVREIALRKLEKTGVRLVLDLYDGGEFPYASDTFDKVYSCLVFHQLDKEVKAHCFREINRVLKPGGEVIISDWGEAKSSLMRLAFYLVQILDGFKTTSDNVNGLLPEYMVDAGFIAVHEKAHINTSIGSLCYYHGFKPK